MGIPGVMEFLPPPIDAWRIGNRAQLNEFAKELLVCMADFKLRSGTETDVIDAYMTVEAQMGNPDCAAWVFLGGTPARRIVGYLFANVVITDGERQCFVWQAYAKQGGVFEEGYRLLHDWAKFRKCMRIYFLTGRKPAAYERKLLRYGFKAKATLFEVKL